MFISDTKKDLSIKESLNQFKKSWHIEFFLIVEKYFQNDLNDIQRDQ